MFKEVAEKHGVSSRMAFGDVENSMRKRWRLNMPVIPQSAEEALAAMTNVPSSYMRHFRCGLNGHYGTALIFYAEGAKAAVAEGNIDFEQINGTFASCKCGRQ